MDVVEVGRPRTHALDHEDPLVASLARKSSITVLVARQSGALGLTCGHGALPDNGGVIAKSYNASGSAAAWVTAFDTNAGGPPQNGKVLRGAITAAADWSVVRFVDTLPPNTDAEHYAVGLDPPLPVSSSLPSVGDTVRHISTVRGKKISGGISAVSAAPLELELPDGTPMYYEPTFSVTTGGEPFSMPGDSGSLIVDINKQAIGVVLGASPSGSVGYGLPIKSLIDALDTNASDFFDV